MNPVAKALWYIESHYAEELSLEDVAAAGGVSRYYMARAFAESTGSPVMRYIRGRRLSEAAKSLAAGASDILAIALEAGYGSHEAFTRAFREQFGLTPEALRALGRLDSLELIDALRLEPTHNVELAEPRIEHRQATLIAGLNARYSYESRGAGIPAQWQRFVPYLGSIPTQVGQATYGVCHNSDHVGIEYLCGVEVVDGSRVPESLAAVRLAEGTYAVFVHRGHVSSIRATYELIWTEWLPRSGQRVDGVPDFERYGAAFDPQMGTGEVEIWVPIARN